MIDLNKLKKNPQLFRLSQIARCADDKLINLVIEYDNHYRQALKKFEYYKTNQKKINFQILTIDKNEKKILIKRMRDLSIKIKKIKIIYKNFKNKRNINLAKIANLIDSDVPKNKDINFIVLKKIGNIRDFKKEKINLKNHLELGEYINAIDIKRAVKTSGPRFCFLKGIGAQIEMALIQLSLKMAIKHGFTPIITPTLVRPEIIAHTGFADHKDEIYFLEKDNLYLTGTSEIALAGLHSKETIDISKGPKRYVGFSTCYRREAGTYGRDNIGIIRMHQFNKVEMFSYTNAKDSRCEHSKLLQWQEEMLSSLELPYRVIEVAAKDLGLSAKKKYDCEAWLPSQNKYQEVTSTSNCGTFQSRGLKIYHHNLKFKNKPSSIYNKKNIVVKKQFVATLNATLVTTRWIAHILENNQHNNFIHIPKVLKPYLNIAKIPFN